MAEEKDMPLGLEYVDAAQFSVHYQRRGTMRLKSEAVRDEIDTLLTQKVKIEHQIDALVVKLNEAIKEETRMQHTMSAARRVQQKYIMLQAELYQVNQRIEANLDSDLGARNSEAMDTYLRKQRDVILRKMIGFKQ